MGNDNTYCDDGPDILMVLWIVTGHYSSSYLATGPVGSYGVTGCYEVAWIHAILLVVAEFQLNMLVR